MDNKYPLLEIRPSVIEKNVRALSDLCEKNNLRLTAVIKGFNALPEIVSSFYEAGCRSMGSSRLPQLQQVKEKYPQVETLALRIPMLSEVEDLVRWADASLESQSETITAIDKEAHAQGKIHKIILMRDLGDLREGCIDREELYSLAEMVENDLNNLHLYGIGTNLTCYGSVIPTDENLSELVEDAEVIEKRIGRRLEIVSGGSTSTVPLVYRGEIPRGITHLRVGEALSVPCDLIDYWKAPVEGMSNSGLVLKAEIIEIGRKPTMPRGLQGVNGLGDDVRYVDRGIRKRVLLALGVLDVGDVSMLIPQDPGVKILGGSSDHLIADIEDSDTDYRLGDTVSFELHYKTQMFATLSPYIKKKVIK